MMLSKKEKIIVMRNGIEIYVSEAQAKRIADIIENTTNRQGKNFFEIDKSRLINLADLVGIFEPIDLLELKKRKNGQWKCDQKWHKRDEDCDCPDLLALEENKKIKEAIEKCKKCDNDGFIRTKENGYRFAKKCLHT